MLSAQPAYALARATFKRAQRGLFGGKHIQFGNNVMSNFQTKMLTEEPFFDIFYSCRTLFPRRRLDATGYPMFKTKTCIQNHSHNSSKLKSPLQFYELSIKREV